MDNTQAFLAIIAVAALTWIAACLVAPGWIGRVTAGVGIATAPWMDVRVASWLTLSDVFLAASVPPLLVAQWQRPRVPITRSSSAWVLAVGVLVLAGGTVGALMTPGDDGFDIALKFATSLVVVAIVVWCVVVDRRSWLRTSTLFVSGAAVSAAVALANPGAYGQGRSLGLTSHPNHLGYSVLLAFALAIGVLASRDFRQRAISLAALPLLGIALLSSGSRAALLGLAVFGVVAVALSKRLRTPALVAGSLLAVALAMLLPGRLDSGPSALSRALSPSELEATSTAERANNIRDAISRVGERPLTGWGFVDTLTFHSVPLQFLVVAGVLGLAAIVVAATAAAGMVVDSSRRDRSLIERSSAAGVVGGFAALLVSNQFFDRYSMVGLLLLSAGAQLSRRDRWTSPHFRSGSPADHDLDADHADRPGAPDGTVRPHSRPDSDEAAQQVYGTSTFE